MECVEQRLDAEAVACGENRPMSFIPQYESEFASQVMQALRADVFIEVQRDLTIRASTQTVARAFEFTLNRFVTVEFSIDHDSREFVLACDGLIASRQVDNAESRVAQGNPTVARNPVALSVGSPMIKTTYSPLQNRFRDRIAVRENGDYPTHLRCSAF
jgi:hypothetical protein